MARYSNILETIGKTRVVRIQPQPMQGWARDFIPKLTSDAVDPKLVYRILPIAGADEIRSSKELAAKEGAFVGISSGGTFTGALQVAREAEKSATSCPCFRTPRSVT